MHRRPPGWELYESDNWLDRGLFGELMLHHNTDCVMCITLCNDIDTSGYQGLEFWKLAVIEWVNHIETLDRRQFVGYNYGFWFRFYINCVNYIETGGWYGPSPYKATIGSSSRHRHRATATSGVHHLSVQNLPSILPTSLSLLSVVNIIGPHFPCRIPRPALKLVNWRRVLLAEACCKSIPHSSVQIGCAENMSRGKEMPQ